MTKVLQRKGNGIKYGLFRQMERRTEQEFQGTTVWSWKNQGCWALVILTKWDIIEGKNVKRMGET